MVQRMLFRATVVTVRQPRGRPAAHSKIYMQKTQPTVPSTTAEISDFASTFAALISIWVSGCQALQRRKPSDSAFANGCRQFHLYGCVHRLWKPSTEPVVVHVRALLDRTKPTRKCFESYGIFRDAPRKPHTCRTCL